MFYRNFSKRYLNFQIIFINIAVDRVLIGVADNFFQLGFIHYRSNYNLRSI